MESCRAVSGETQITKALAALTKGKTVITIAHRLKTIERADKIVVLENGFVSAVGDHMELMESSPLYRKLQEMSALSGQWNIAVKEGENV